jgi:polyferredoxin
LCSPATIGGDASARWRSFPSAAFFGRAGQRRAGPWLRTHGARLAFSIFLISLWLRLVATNGDGYAIALFLIGIAVAAFVTGLLFTGKTWCNYVCPVYFVEKLYTEPRGLRDTPNSLCQPCTACRPSCPDINEESSYWKEILLPDKRQVFYAFPGVVLAFYVYYFVQAGNWAYYFGGSWTHEVGLVRTAFLPGTNAATAGIYFWPTVPARWRRR